MPSAPSDKGKSEKDKSRGGGSKDKSGGSSKPDKSNDSDRPQTVAEIKADEYQVFITACVRSHAAWLSTPLTNISTALSVPIPQLSILLLILLTLLLLLSPTSWIPYIASPITFLIPLRNTLKAIGKNKKGLSGSDGIQWMVFWTGWVGAGWIGEGIRVFRPGWMGVWAVGKVGVGVVLAGPWFGRLAMVKGKSSAKLAEAEKREAAEEAKKAKDEEKKKEKAEAKIAKESAESEDAVKARAEEKAKERAKAKAKEDVKA